MRMPFIHTEITFDKRAFGVFQPGTLPALVSQWQAGLNLEPLDPGMNK